MFTPARYDSHKKKQVFDSLLQMELYNLNPARNKCPFPAEAPPLRESGADASTASSSSMVYVIGLPAPAFPAFGPQVDWPDTDIGPTSRWHSFMSLRGKNHRVSRFPMFEMLAVGAFLVFNQVSRG